jgi:hypothetical protein
MRTPIIFAAGLAVVLSCTASRAESPKETMHLFNGKDLTGFYTYIQGIGKNSDPKKVFTVEDGAIHVSGDGYGGFITEKEYENYHLIVEFKWGEKTWGRREKAARDSGILLHCTGEEGYNGGPWMESIECQMIEGGTGDILLVRGKNQPTCMAPAEQRGREWYYTKGAPEHKFPPGRLNWWGRSPEWKDVKGFRGKQDVERPVGEWNTLEVLADGDKLTYTLNGQFVNAATNCSHTKGKLLFQTEGAEVFFRKIDMKPLK